ncbi:MAG TPA: RpiB/LacA/LacB family sugar-phosphate isomerase [Patescibacteria group bacterium]|nr:RpiB/LacA/LacB family sugar-phosphate isomerase [Patescibacteria group bacterium]
MKIYIAADHTGLDLKAAIRRYLVDDNYDVEDCGPEKYDPDDDYPDFIGLAAQKVSQNPGSFGIVIGGSGQGEQMAANKYPGIRCALFYTAAAPIDSIDINGTKSSDPFEIVKLARIHNNANMLSFGVRFVTKEDAEKASKVFIETPFSGEARHQRRIDKITAIENRS